MKEEIKTKADVQELDYALDLAVNEAMVLSRTEDGGTCNMDCLTLKIKIPRRFIPMLNVGMQKMHTTDYGKIWNGHYMVDIPVSGQGNRRTRMVEAACRSLRKSGFDAVVYYMID